LRQAYDYWQNQPGSYLEPGRTRGQPPPKERLRFAETETPPGRVAEPPLSTSVVKFLPQKPAAAAPDCTRKKPGQPIARHERGPHPPAHPEGSRRGDSPDGLRQTVAIGQQSGTSTGAVRRVARTTELKSPSEARERPMSVSHVNTSSSRSARATKSSNVR
jgi:hypothetical protein